MTHTKNHTRFLILAAALWLILTATSIRIVQKRLINAQPEVFQGQRALADVAYQVNMGPRYPGSQAHHQVIEWILGELSEAGWETDLQETTQLNHEITNIVAKRGGAGAGWVILGAHYDTRFHADRDPDPAKRDQPVPGANDGASGVAVLLELARSLPKELPGDTWLVFFDGEDNGGFHDWDWILGSRAIMRYLDDPMNGKSNQRPEVVIILDMIGDADLDIYQERNSDPVITEEIWATAARLGHAEHFIAAKKHALLDDHIPFIQAGIPAVDIIDFQYPYWHTTADTTDKVSAQSLQIVGEVVTDWLLTR
jgi:glutaminyl-peptide cyclotransferase